jgi:hypothetical protein
VFERLVASCATSRVTGAAALDEVRAFCADPNHGGAPELLTAGARLAVADARTAGLVADGPLYARPTVLGDHHQATACALLYRASLPELDDDLTEWAQKWGALFPPECSVITATELASYDRYIRARLEAAQ